MAKYCIILLICFFAAFTYYHGVPTDDSAAGASLVDTCVAALCFAAAYLAISRLTDPFRMRCRWGDLNWSRPQSQFIGGIALGCGLFSLQPVLPFDATIFLALAIMLGLIVGVIAAAAWRAGLALPFGTLALYGVALILAVAVVSIGTRVSILVALLTLAEFGCLSLAFSRLEEDGGAALRPWPRLALLWAAIAVTIAITTYALANNAVFICVTALCILIFLDLPSRTDAETRDDALLSRLYWTAGLAFWLALVAYTVAEPLNGRVIYAIFCTSLIIPFGHWLMFGRATSGDLVALVRPVLYFNLMVVVFHYIFSNEFVHLREDFHIGYHFGNFSDFMAIIDTQVSGTYTYILTGYEPFVYSFAKFFGTWSHWQPGPFNFTEHLQLYYLIFLVVGFAPFGLLLYDVYKARSLNVDQGFFGGLFLLTCYPVLFEIERGNFILLSAAFLALAVWCFQRGYLRSTAIFIGLLVSLKILNVVYIPFVLRNLWTKLNWFVGTVALATFTSLLFLAGLDFKKWLMFARVLLVPIGGMFGGIAAPLMTDSGKLAGGTTGIDAYRVLLRSLFLRLKDNVTTDMGWFNLTLLIGGVCVIVYFYWRVRKKSDWNDELLVLSVVPLLAHPASGSYNLLLLLPMLLELARRPSSPHRDRLLRFALPVLLLSAGIVLTTITCCGPYYTPVTPESFLVPFALATLCLQLLLQRGASASAA